MLDLLEVVPGRAASSTCTSTASSCSRSRCSGATRSRTTSRRSCASGSHPADRLARRAIALGPVGAPTAVRPAATAVVIRSASPSSPGAAHRCRPVSERPEDGPAEQREHAGDHEGGTPRRGGDEGGDTRSALRCRRRRASSAGTRARLRSPGCRPAPRRRRRRARSTRARSPRRRPAPGREPSAGARANAPTSTRLAVTASASRRSGTIREPRRSDQWPATTRKPPPSTCEAASTSAAEPVEKPLPSLRNSTVKLIVAVWPTMISALPDETSQIAGRRSGAARSSVTLADGASRSGSRRRRAPASAPTAQAAATAANVQPRPAAAASGGSASAATSPPRGTFAWRMPSARPRSEAAEPLHHGAPARGVDARAERSGGRRAGGRAPRSSRETPIARERAEPRRRARGEDDSLADPVREQPPGKERRCHPDRERREHDPGLRDRELELLPQLRREHRDAEHRRRDAALGRRPDAEHDPSVAGRGHVGTLPVGFRWTSAAPPPCDDGEPAKENAPSR